MEYFQWVLDPKSRPDLDWFLAKQSMQGERLQDKISVQSHAAGGSNGETNLVQLTEVQCDNAGFPVRQGHLSFTVSASAVRRVPKEDLTEDELELLRDNSGIESKSKCHQEQEEDPKEKYKEFLSASFAEQVSKTKAFYKMAVRAFNMAVVPR